MGRFTHHLRLALRLPLVAACAYAINLQAETILVSQSSDGEQGRGSSAFPSISDNGRFIAFISSADNLVPDDTNGEPDSFVHDRLTGKTTRVSVTSDGTEASDGVWWTVKSLSADGRYVVFSSESDNLVEGDTNGTHDVFLHDRDTGETSRVSVAENGRNANNWSLAPGIYGNGRYVTFESSADNLVAGDTNNYKDIFMYDRETGLTRRVNIASDGSQANSVPVFHSYIWWYTNPVSDNGRYVAFTSWSSNLVPGDDNEVQDVFVHDLETGNTERVSLTIDGGQSRNSSLLLDMSDDGRYVAYFSLPPPGSDPQNVTDPGGLFIHNRDTDETTRLPTGSTWAAFSNGGRYLVYDYSTGLHDPLQQEIPSGTYVLDQLSGETLQSLVSYQGNPVEGYSTFAAISGDGRTIATGSSAANLVPGDNNTSGDIFAFDNPHLFLINAGLNDAWYDPGNPGQGFHLTALSKSQAMFITWVTFDSKQHDHSDASPLGGRGQRWLTAYGPYDGRKALLEVSSTMGGLFDSTESVPATYPVGTMTVEFTHCTNGTIKYDFPTIYQHRVIKIQRVALDNIPLCELLNDLDRETD